MRPVVRGGLSPTGGGRREYLCASRSTAPASRSPHQQYFAIVQALRFLRQGGGSNELLENMEEGDRRLGVSAVVYLSAGAALTRGFHFPWSERGRDCLHQDIPVIFGRQTVSIAGFHQQDIVPHSTGSSRKRCYAPCSGLETDHTHAAGHCIHSPQTCPDNLRLQSGQRGCIHAQSAAVMVSTSRCCSTPAEVAAERFSRVFKTGAGSFCLCV